MLPRSVPPPLPLSSTKPFRIMRFAHVANVARARNVDPAPGNFKKKNIECRVALCTFAGKKFFATQEEKRTDVNIAVYMLDDGYRNLADTFVLVSGDSDLVPPIS